MNENENLTQEELDYLNSKKGKLLNRSFIQHPVS